MVLLGKLVKEVRILSRVILEEKQLWREMLRDTFFPHLSSLRYHSHRKHDRDHSHRRTGGGKREKNSKRKEKRKWGKKLEGELLMKIERRKVNNLPTGPFRVTNINEVWDLLVSCKTDCSINTLFNFCLNTGIYVYICFHICSVLERTPRSDSCRLNSSRLTLVMFGLVNEKSL